MEENKRWKFDEEEWKDKFDKAFDKALETWRLSWTDGSMDHQTTATKKWGAEVGAWKVHSDSTRHSEFDKEEVNNVEAIWKLGYAVKVFDKSPGRALEEKRDKEEVNDVEAMCQLGYAVKVCDGSPERVFTSTGTQPDFSPHINPHFNGYAKFGKGTDVGCYGEVGTDIWGSYKDGGSGGGPGQGRVRTLDIPRFDGKDPNGWVMRVERILYEYRVSEDELLEAVEMAFVGDVLRWYQWENKRHPFRCWSDLKEIILRQLCSSTYQNFNSSYGGHGDYGGRSEFRGEGCHPKECSDNVFVNKSVYYVSPYCLASVNEEHSSTDRVLSNGFQLVNVVEKPFIASLDDKSSGDEVKKCLGDNVFRMLAPVQKVGSIMGRKEEYIKKTCEGIQTIDGRSRTNESTVRIFAKEQSESDANSPQAVDGLLKSHKRIINVDADPAHAQPGAVGTVGTRMFVAASWNIWHNDDEDIGLFASTKCDEDVKEANAVWECVDNLQGAITESASIREGIFATGSSLIELAEIELADSSKVGSQLFDSAKPLRDKHSRGSSGLVDESLSVFTRLKRQGMKFPPVTWASRIASWPRHGRDIDGPEFFRELPRHQILNNLAADPVTEWQRLWQAEEIGGNQHDIATSQQLIEPSFDTGMVGLVTGMHIVVGVKPHTPNLVVKRVPSMFILKLSKVITTDLGENKLLIYDPGGGTIGVYSHSAEDDYAKKKGMVNAVEEIGIYSNDPIISNLRSRATMINTPEEIVQVATISAIGEREIGELIGRAMEKVGKERVITVDGNTPYNALEVVERMKLGGGYISLYFVTDEKTQNCELENPLILIHDKNISDVNVLVRILKRAIKRKRPLLLEQDDLNMVYDGAIRNHKFESPQPSAVILWYWSVIRWIFDPGDSNCY